jgi:glycerol-3-phosphate dehydrogenase
MACTLADLLVRRTHLAFETSDHGLGVAPRVVNAVAPLLEWGADDRRHALELYSRDVQRLFGIDAG